MAAIDGTVRPRSPRVAAVVGMAGRQVAEVWRVVCRALGVFDWIAAAGVVLLFVGLVLWFGAAVACTAVGGLLLVLGIAGGRAAARAALPAQAGAGWGIDSREGDGGR
jgi:hypothetical protein